MIIPWKRFSPRTTMQFFWFATPRPTFAVQDEIEVELAEIQPKLSPELDAILANNLAANEALIDAEPDANRKLILAEICADIHAKLKVDLVAINAKSVDQLLADIAARNDASFQTAQELRTADTEDNPRSTNLYDLPLMRHNARSFSGPDEIEPFDASPLPPALLPDLRPRRTRQNPMRKPLANSADAPTPSHAGEGRCE